MALMKKEEIPQAYAESVEEIMRLYKSLPPRPSIEEVEAAISVIKTIESEEHLRLDEIAKEQPPQDVPPQLFSVLQEVKKSMVILHSHEQKKEAVHLVQLDKILLTFDDLIQRASELVSEETHLEEDEENEEIEIEYRIGRDFGIDSDQVVSKQKGDEESKTEPVKDLIRSYSSKNSFLSTGEEPEKMSLMKVAAVIEKCVRTEDEVLNLQGKLMDKVEWLPLSLGKLCKVVELNFSENQILALPTTMGSLKCLTKLDVHSNQLINLPESFGELLHLTDLDLSANRLRTLPESFRNLEKLIKLDLSSNRFTHLPDLVGNLSSLERLNVEINDLEELPYTIGFCLSLVELRLDFNQIKALPEAIGKLGSLEILTLHYNRIKGLPSSMGNLSSLRELDISFNEVEMIPESFCFATKLEKLKISSNFADLSSLPRSIGNLENLEELDISNNQIRVLPDSFRCLSKLKVLRADEIPLELPPKHILKQGAQAVVQYMDDLVAKQGMISQISKKKRGWCLDMFSHCFGIDS